MGRDSLIAYPCRFSRFGAVVLFMLIYYRGYGLMANIALIAYGAIVCFGRFKCDFNLTGYSGFNFIFRYGSDANIVIFERIKEELRNGHTVRTAVEVGFVLA